MTRLTASEYTVHPGWVRLAANQSGVEADELRRLLERASSRIRTLLKQGEDPIGITGDSLELRGFAGLVRLSRTIELEVAPKFLDPSNPSWREDFFYLANNSTQGRVLCAEELSASGASRNDLASLVGRAFVDEFQRHARRPLREYRSLHWSDWYLDGDVDDTALLMPDDAGFSQRGVVLERRNPFNAVVREAAVQLLPIVADPVVRLQLTRVRDQIGPQQGLRGLPRPRSLPSRHRRWEPLYELSVQILNGLGISLTPGKLNAPGYVVSTWQAWESLIRGVVQLRFPLDAQYHEKHPLGTRNTTQTIEVEPDLTIRPLHREPLVVDAKYKGRQDQRPRVAEADLYEAMAFLRATSARLAVLIYPLVPDGPEVGSPGSTRVFDRIEVSDGTVIGASLDVRGISSKGGYRAVADGVAQLITSESILP